MKTMPLLLISFFFMMILSCSNVLPGNPEAVLAWSDDGIEIACAINKWNYEDNPSATASDPSNQRYDLFLCDTLGAFETQLYKNRKVDNYESAVSALYYMKNEGYLIIKSKLFGSGTVIEKLTLSQQNTVLWGRSQGTFNFSTSDLNDVSVIPSLSGKTLLLAVSTGSGQCTFTVKFYDAQTLQQTGVTQTFAFSEDHHIRWLTDSLVFFIDSTGAKRLGPSLAVADTAAQQYYYPATSSSIYDPIQGFAIWDVLVESIVFLDTVFTDYDRWDLTGF